MFDGADEPLLDTTDAARLLGLEERMIIYPSELQATAEARACLTRSARPLTSP